MTNIELPRDAAGREIPLDTEIVYSRDGNKLCISRIEFSPLCKEWSLRIVGIDGKIFRTWVLYPWQAYIEKPAQPDSWDKLLDDLDNAAKGGDNAECLYMRREDIEVGEQCSGCRLYNADDVFSDCSLLAYADIADRIRKLRSEGE